MILLVSLTSCVGIVDVQITGSLREGVTFSLYRHNTNELLDNMSVRYVYVNDVTDDKLEPIWRLNGNAVISTIKYGDKIAGLTQDIEPKSFSSKRLYQVSVGLNTNPPSSGGGHFCFTDTGKLVRLKSFEEVQSKCDIQNPAEITVINQ